MSKSGKAALDGHRIKYEYNTLVDRIDCLTEEIFANENDPQKASEMIKQRAGL